MGESRFPTAERGSFLTKAKMVDAGLPRCGHLAGMQIEGSNQIV